MSIISLTTDEWVKRVDNIVKTAYTLQIMTESMCRNRGCDECPLNIPCEDGCVMVKLNMAIELAPQLNNALITLRSECKHAKERKQKCQKTHR